MNETLNERQQSVCDFLRHYQNTLTQELKTSVAVLDTPRSLYNNPYHDLFCNKNEYKFFVSSTGRR